jgi:hypothetical protein
MPIYVINKISIQMVKTYVVSYETQCFASIVEVARP